MASKTNVFETSFLGLVFINQPVTGIGDLNGLRGSSSPGNLYLSLHTNDPGENGNQDSYEATFTGYERAAITRTASSWTLSTAQIQNTQVITFTECSSGEEVLTHFALGVSATGPDQVLFRGPLSTASLGLFTAKTDNTISIPGLTGLSVNDKIVFYPVLGSNLPSEINSGTTYWVKTLTGTQLTISSSLGGSTLSLSTEGSGVAFKLQSITVSPGVTLQFPANSLVIRED